MVAFSRFGLLGTMLANMPLGLRLKTEKTAPEFSLEFHVADAYGNPYPPMDGKMLFEYKNGHFRISGVELDGRVHKQLIPINGWNPADIPTASFELDTDGDGINDWRFRPTRSLYRSDAQRPDRWVISHLGGQAKYYAAGYLTHPSEKVMQGWILNSNLSDEEKVNALFAHVVEHIDNRDFAAALVELENVAVPVEKEFLVEAKQDLKNEILFAQVDEHIDNRDFAAALADLEKIAVEKKDLVEAKRDLIMAKAVVEVKGDDESKFFYRNDKLIAMEVKDGDQSVFVDIAEIRSEAADVVGAAKDDNGRTFYQVKIGDKKYTVREESEELHLVKGVKDTETFDQAKIIACANHTDLEMKANKENIVNIDTKLARDDVDVLKYQIEDKDWIASASEFSKTKVDVDFKFGSEQTTLGVLLSLIGILVVMYGLVCYAFGWCDDEPEGDSETKTES